jgi:exportin-T
MELVDIERVIARANSSANAEDQRQANSMLDGLRQAPDSWSWGLRLFFESTQPVARFFGLSLTRAQMALGVDRAPGLEARRQVRSSLMTWVQQVLSTPVSAPGPAGVKNDGVGGSGSSPQSSGVAGSSSPETYLLSNVTAVLTLCIKWDFPEDWRTAFSELLAVGAAKPEGTEMVLAVLENFDADVVVFNESRTREEWTHNTAIKDCMRGDGINAAVVQFLLQRAVILRDQRPELSNKCLVVLSLFVSWVDINLILDQQTLALLYQALADRALWAGACLCLIEVVKKGMSAPLKMELLRTTHVLEALATTCAGPVSEDLGEHLAPLVDAVFIEVLDVWAACEKGDAEVLPLMPQVADALRCCMTCVLPLFRESNFDVAVFLVPSLNRFAQLLKSQAKATPSSAQASLRTAFDAKQYLPEYLASVFAQLQFDDDFDFDAQDEDDCEEIEVSLT